MDLSVAALSTRDRAIFTTLCYQDMPAELAGRIIRLRRVLSTGWCAPEYVIKDRSGGPLDGAANAAPWGEAGESRPGNLRARTRQLTSQAYEGIAVHRSSLPGDRRGYTPLPPTAVPRQDSRIDPLEAEDRFARFSAYGDDIGDPMTGHTPHAAHATRGRDHTHRQRSGPRGVHRHVKRGVGKKKWLFVPVAAMAAVFTGGIAMAATGVTGIQFRVASPVTVQALGVDVSHAAVDQTVTAGAKVVAEHTTTMSEVAIAVTAPNGARVDFPHAHAWKLGTSQRVFSRSKAFSHSGTYTYWFTYKKSGHWIGVGPKQTFTIGNVSSPTPGPSPSASSPRPTPSPSTTPTWSPSSSPSGSPSSGGSSGGSTPSAGFPDAANTGVPAGVSLKPMTGELTISKAGTVVDGIDLVGKIVVTADNVTIKRSRITAPKNLPNEGRGEFTLIQQATSASNLTLEDCELDGSGIVYRTLTAFNSVTMTRCETRNTGHGAEVGSNYTIEDNWMHDATDGPDHNWHVDGVISAGGTNGLIEHNNIELTGGSMTGTIDLGSSIEPIHNVIIRDNLLSGGSYCVYIENKGNPISGIQALDNRFSTRDYPKVGLYGVWYPNRVPSDLVRRGNEIFETGAHADS